MKSFDDGTLFYKLAKEHAWHARGGLSFARSERESIA
jgi:hypothetical protein